MISTEGPIALKRKNFILKDLKFAYTMITIASEIQGKCCPSGAIQHQTFKPEEPSTIRSKKTRASLCFSSEHQPETRDENFNPCVV